jgi:DNA-binding SARP family transcriptional activator
VASRLTSSMPASTRTLTHGPQAIVRLSLLGGFSLTVEGEMASVPVGSQRLLSFLAMAPRPLLRPYVAGNLWGDVPERQAHANLRSTLWRLHRPGPLLVEATRTHLQLARGIEVDFRESVALARGILDGGAGTEDADQMRLVGDLLPDWYDDWVVMSREEFRQLRLHALERLCERLIDAGRYGRAVQAGLAAVAAEPLRESGQRALIRAHLAEGNSIEALRQYRAYHDLVRAELDLEPSPSLTGLMGQVLRSVEGRRPRQMRTRRP